MADRETPTASTHSVDRIDGPTDTSLKERTVQLRKELNEWLPEGALDSFDEGAEETSRDLLPDAVSVGDQAPDFRLPDARGGEVELSSLLESGPVVMVFYRGEWCPYCNLQLAAFQESLDEIEAAGASLLAISPQTPDASLTHAEKHELRFGVLSDLRNKVATEYGLVIRQPDVTTAKQLEVGEELGLNVDVTTFSGDDSKEFPAAATYVVGQDGNIQWLSVSTDYRWRVGPEEVLEVLRGA